jgi:hypothetical protein
MDQGRDDQLGTTDMAETREAPADASEPRSGWVRPAEEETETAVAEDATEHQTETAVAEDATEHQTETAVAEDATEHPTETPVAEDATEHPADAPVAEDAAETPDPALHAGTLADARPATPHVTENGLTAAVSVLEPQPELEGPVETRAQQSPALDRPQAEAPAEGEVELMAVDSRERYRARWSDIQIGFVDDPAEAVREADHLVADVIEHLATTFAEERARLEERWSQGNEDTEHLRTALQRYRQFFGLLLQE